MKDLFGGSRVLVTGASMGLGETFARRLGSLGSDLVLTARSKDKLDAIAADLTSSYGVRVETIGLDLAEPGGAAALCEKLDALGWDLEHIVNNAGFGSAGPFASLPVKHEAAMVRLNCEALVTITGHFLPRLLQAGRGGVLQVASVAGMQPVPYMATYAATKAFVVSYSAALAEEIRGRGVRMMALCPGPVPTHFQQNAKMHIGRSERAAVLSPEDTVERALEAYAAREEVYVPGLVNKLGAAASKVVPRPVITRMVAKMMRDSGRG